MGGKLVALFFVPGWLVTHCCGRALDMMFLSDSQMGGLCTAAAANVMQIQLTSPNS